MWVALRLRRCAQGFLSLQRAGSSGPGRAAPVGMEQGLRAPLALGARPWWVWSRDFRLLWPWVHGPGGCGAGTSGSSGPGCTAPVGVEQGLRAPLALGARPRWVWSRGLLVLQHVGSSGTGDQTWILCVSRQIPIHCVTRKSLWSIFLNKQKRICSIFFCTLDYLGGLQTVSWRRLSIVLYSAAYLHIWFSQQVYWAQELGLKLLCKLYSVWNIKLLIISLVWGNDQKWESARLGPLPACCFVFGSWGRRD